MTTNCVVYLSDGLMRLSVTIANDCLLWRITDWVGLSLASAPFSFYRVLRCSEERVFFLIEDGKSVGNEIVNFLILWKSSVFVVNPRILLRRPVFGRRFTGRVANTRASTLEFSLRPLAKSQAFGGRGISIPQRRDGSSGENTVVDWGGFLRSAIVFRSNANTDIEERIAECEPSEFNYAMPDTRARFSFNERETRLSRLFAHFRAFDFFEISVRSGFVSYVYGGRFLTVSWQIGWHVGLATYRVKLLNFHRSTNLANTLRIWNFSAAKL